MELDLRDIDTLENVAEEGDAKFLKQFRDFEIRKRKNKVSTINMYTSAIKNHILPAFHQLYDPFEAEWILDCTTLKDCCFSGQKRQFLSPEEPAYFTSRILEEALKVIDSYGGRSGSERGTLLAASMDLVDFIEFHFNQRLNVYGPEPLAKLVPYHNGIRSYLKGTGSWTKSNDERAQAHENKKMIETYESPHKDIEILEKYKRYIESPSRINNITKVLNFATDDSPLPKPAEMTELGKITMGEVVCTTGCRPVVVRRLTNGSYGDKKPGFNPRKTSADDCVLEEEIENMKIFRRVDPNLPPRDRACKHQLEERTAECSVLCDDRVDPDGYNIFVTWDKTQGTKGPSYLHITKPLKVLMDCYFAIRSKFFQNKKAPSKLNDDWEHDDDTFFFLKSSGTGFEFLDMKHVSDEMGCDVTAYSFRRIVCTWGVSHEDSNIRGAEEQTLQHTMEIAKQRYQQNKQLLPQTFTQRYIEEENLFPKHIVDQIEKTEKSTKEMVKKTEKRRAKQRFKNLSEGREAYQTARKENRSLGINNRIFWTDKKKFKEILGNLQKRSFDSLLEEMKPKDWRQFIVRMVCTATGSEGEELREVWKKVYKGDLMWGVRDMRTRHLSKQSRKTRHGNDRNSWIASSLRQVLLKERTKDNN